MADSGDSNSRSVGFNYKFVGIIGLSLGIASGIVLINGNEYLHGFGVTIGGIPAGFFIYSLLKTKELKKNETMFLAGFASGYFFSTFIITVLNILLQ